jgi:hypothetical protein
VTRPRIIDTFPIHDELDLLELRLTELYDTVDWFVAVEADVTHQDRPKPFYVTENLDRFAPWKDKLVVVRATGLPTVQEDDDPWARELTQRGFAWEGLVQIGAADDDIVLHSDVDEIPRTLHVRNVRPAPGWFVSFQQTLYCFAIDWQHPDPWFGTVAGRAGDIAALGDNVNAFARLRDKRNRWSQPGSRVNPQPLVEAGWHFSWLGGQAAATKKLNSFCHPEVADRIGTGLADDLFYREGLHVDGRKQAPVDVDDTYPKWIREGHAPASWYRPR